MITICFEAISNFFSYAGYSMYQISISYFVQYVLYKNYLHCRHLMNQLIVPLYWDYFASAYT